MGIFLLLSAENADFDVLCFTGDIIEFLFHRDRHNKALDKFFFNIWRRLEGNTSHDGNSVKTAKIEYDREFIVVNDDLYAIEISQLINDSA